MLHNLAKVVHEQSRVDEAEALYQEALQQCQVLSMLRPGLHGEVTIRHITVRYCIQISLRSL